MIHNYKEETEKRVAFIKETIKNAHANGVVFGNSGGKDCALVGILCKMACEKTVGVIMPCSSKRNFGEDMKDGIEVAEKFGIETRVVDITDIKEKFIDVLKDVTTLNEMGDTNINPRLRMTTLYAIGASENLLVAGTGNRSERYMGYFTKWGDGACDFNPISDLTVKEVYEFLAYLGAPEAIMTKAPSAALFEGQNDEDDMGIKYADIDNFLLTGEISDENRKIVERYNGRSRHKVKMPAMYKEIEE